MSSPTARKATRRCGAAAPTMTATSPTGTIPIRCQSTIVEAPVRSPTSWASRRIASSATERWVSYSSARTRPPRARSGRTIPSKTTTPPRPARWSSTSARAVEIGVEETRTDTLSPHCREDGSRARLRGAPCLPFRGRTPSSRGTERGHRSVAASDTVARARRGPPAPSLRRTGPPRRARKRPPPPERRRTAERGDVAARPENNPVRKTAPRPPARVTH